jgi:diguanylate cyclase (GGDEF)-like protein
VTARVGGEEFAILLPETDPEEHASPPSGCVNAVAARPVPCPGGHLAITISIGATVAGSTTVGPTEIMKRADEALYAAKRAGRNRVRTASALQEMLHPAE